MSEHLNNLYNYTQIGNAFTTVTANNKKKQESDEALFKLADVNGDGVVDEKDKKIIDSKLKEASSVKNLYDVTGDGKVDLDDLINFSKEMGLDKEGMSDAQKAFMRQHRDELVKKLIKDLKNNKDISFNDFIKFQDMLASLPASQREELKDVLQAYEKALFDTILSNKNFDLDGSGKVDPGDYRAFLEMTSREFISAGNSVEDFLKKYKEKLGAKTLDFYKNGKVGQDDLAKLQYQIEQAMKYLNGEKGAYGKLSDNALLKKFDKNGDGVFDEKDIEAMKEYISLVMGHLGMEDADGDGQLTIDDLKKIKQDYKDAKAEKKAKDAELKQAEKDRIAAEKALKKAEKAAEAAKKAFDKIAEKFDPDTEANLNKAETELEKLKDELKELEESGASKAEIDAKKKEIKQKEEEAAKLANEMNTYNAAKEKAETTATTAANAKEKHEAAVIKHSEAKDAVKEAKANLDAKKSEYDKVAKFFEYSKNLKISKGKSIKPPPPPPPPEAAKSTGRRTTTTKKTSSPFAKVVAKVKAAVKKVAAAIKKIFKK